MVMVRMRPFGDIQRLQRQMNRLFDDSVGRGEEGRDPNLGRAWSPPVDIREDSQRIVLSVEIAGVDQGDVSVSIDEGRLTVSGERRLPSAENDYARVERQYGPFERSFMLPPTVDPARVEAQMERGVLEITLGKRDEARPRQIEVKG
jgi:HSP20 family protein